MEHKTHKIEPISREFLLSRKECCGSGCKNCPYLPRHTKESKKIGQEVFTSCPILDQKKQIS